MSLTVWGVLILTWASYQIRKIAVCACAGNAGNVFPHRRFRRKPLVSDPGMHHDTCVTHVPWCMSGSLTCGAGENVPGIPGACAPAILRIWQEAHGLTFIPAWKWSHSQWSVGWNYLSMLRLKLVAGDGDEDRLTCGEQETHYYSTRLYWLASLTTATWLNVR